MKKRILTGIKPTGNLHIGNYFGVIKPIIEMQGKEEIFLFVADLHSLTNLSDGTKKHNAKQLKDNTNEVIAAFLAFGADPKKIIIYKQSDFPQITELSWIFYCLLNENYLNIGHAYKDFKNKHNNVGLGVFLYPGLMAADILISKTTIVPVGEDQKQHIEIARDIAKKFNRITGTDFFSEPKERIMHIRTIRGIDGQKMSKSYNNTLPIFAKEEDIRKKISRIKTDSTPSGEKINTDSLIFEYLKLFLEEKKYKEIEDMSSKGGVTYSELKNLLTDTYLSYFYDAREKYNNIMRKNKYIEEILYKNKKKIDKEFNKTLDDVKKIIGM